MTIYPTKIRTMTNGQMTYGQITNLSMAIGVDDIWQGDI